MMYKYIYFIVCDVGIYLLIYLSDMNKIVCVFCL
jgi:hypothetical protein